MLWRLMADIVVTLHAGYIAIVVVGLGLILVGSFAEWHWVRNFYLRVAHLAMILLVCAEDTECGAQRTGRATRALAEHSVGSEREYLL